MAEIHHGRKSVLADEAALQLKQGETIIRSGLLAEAIKQHDTLTIEQVTEAARVQGERRPRGSRRLRVNQLKTRSNRKSRTE